MKLVIFCSLLILVSCDNMSRNRKKALSQNRNYFESNRGIISDENAENAPPNNSPQPPVSPPSNFPPEFSMCEDEFATLGGGHYRFGNTTSFHLLGPYNICKNMQGKILIQLQLSHESRVCAIPLTHTYNAGQRQVTHIGNAQCFFALSPGFIQPPITFTRDRQGYELANLTGVMFVKDQVYEFDPPYASPMDGVSAFFYCMNYKANKIANPNYGPYPADAFCNAFVKLGKYVNHAF